MSSQAIAYANPAVATPCDVTGTAFERRSEPFSVTPTLASTAFHAVAFCVTTYGLKAMPLGAFDALRSSVGIIMIGGVGAVQIFPTATGRRA